MPHKKEIAPIFLSTERLILASASPRRRRFLQDLGLDFTCDTVELDETPRPEEEPAAFVSRIALEKAAVVADRHPEDVWVLGADTIVALDDEILGKPADQAAALATLKRLSGRWHAVWTGFCLYRRHDRKGISHAVRTSVRFANLADELWASYLATGAPLDKAGSYGIQGYGGFMVREISGSYSNVVGLPLSEVVEVLLALKVIRPRLALT